MTFAALGLFTAKGKSNPNFVHFFLAFLLKQASCEMEKPSLKRSRWKYSHLTADTAVTRPR